jgi:hypothetical protein
LVFSKPTELRAFVSKYYSNPFGDFVYTFSYSNVILQKKKKNFSMKTQAWIPLKKTSEKSSKMNMWMDHELVLVFGDSVSVFNSELQVSDSMRIMCDVGLKIEKCLYYLQKNRLSRLLLGETCTLADDVFYINLFNNELLTIFKNGTITSNGINIEQNGKVLHAAVINDTVGLVFQTEKTVVQFHTANGMKEFEIHLEESPNGFAIGTDCCFITYQKKLVIQHRDRYFAYDIESNASITSLGDSVALIQHSQGKSMLKVWESKYGTLQHQQQLFEDSSPGAKFFFISYGISTSYGNVLLLSVATKQGKLFSVECGLLPYHQAPVSLLESLGKLSTSESHFDKVNLKGIFTSIIPVLPPQEVQKTKPLKIWKRKVIEWNDLDHQFLSKLVNLNSVPEFQSTFVDWIFTKHSSLRNWSVLGVSKLKKSSANGNSDSLLHLPRTELSRKSMEMLIRYCFDNSKFWPRVVVEYLIYTGNVSSHMADGFIEKLIDLKELNLIKASLEHVMDLTERDYVTVLKFVTDSAYKAEFLKWSKNEDENYKKKMHDTNPHKMERLPENIMKRHEPVPEPSVVGVELNEGQKEFLYLCFSNRFVHAVMAHELIDLDTEHIHIVLEWIRTIIAPIFDEDLDNRNPNQKFPLWWCWYDTPFDAPYAEAYSKEFSKYNTV